MSFVSDKPRIDNNNLFVTTPQHRADHLPTLRMGTSEITTSHTRAPHWQSGNEPYGTNFVPQPQRLTFAHTHKIADVIA